MTPAKAKVVAAAKNAPLFYVNQNGGFWKAINLTTGKRALWLSSELKAQDLAKFTAELDSIAE